METISFLAASVYHSVGDAFTANPVLADLMGFYAHHKDPKNNAPPPSWTKSHTPAADELETRLFNGLTPNGGRLDGAHRMSMRNDDLFNEEADCIAHGFYLREREANLLRAFQEM